MMISFSKIRQVLILMSLIALTACNSGEGQSKKQPAATESTQIRGQIFKGPVSHARVRAFDEIGNYLGETVTDDKGFYQLSLNPSYRGVVRIDAKGGNYVDEATGVLTPLTESLSALSVLSENETVMNVTPLTELAVRATRIDRSPRKIAWANRHIAILMGLDLDIVRETPVDLLDTAHRGKSGANVDYALVIAGMTQMAETQGIDFGKLVNAFRLNGNGQVEDEQQLTRLNTGINAFLDSVQNKVIVDRKRYYRNNPPVLEQLDWQNVFEGFEFRFAPKVSDDRGGLTYRWQQTFGPEIQFEGTNTAAITFRAPVTEEKETFEFQLTVTDSGGLSVSQKYVVRVMPTPVISGVAFKGPIQGATVKITQVDGTLIGETTTASDGRYQIKNTHAYQGLVIAEVTGGTYVSEATGQTVSLEQTLRAVTNMKATNTSLNITPFTELAFRRAKHLGETLDVSKVEQAALDVSRAFGVFGLVNNEPLNLMDPSSKINSFSTESDYALSLAAVMVAMHKSSQSLAEWLDRVSEDLSDNGKIDDIETLNALYRGVYSFIKSPQNKAKITEHDSIVYLSFYRSTPPTIVSISPSDGHERAQINVFVQAQDTGIGGIRFYSLEQQSGPAADFREKQFESPLKIRLPELNGEQAETLTFKLTVRDWDELTASATFSIQVQPYPDIVLDKIIDPQLRQCIESHSPKIHDIGGLRSLQCGPDYAGISQLDGMEQFVYLTNFEVLAKNQIRDLTPLADLPNLSGLAVEQTVMTDLTAFTVLKKLEDLSLKDSLLLTDFSALPQLTGLQEGNFYGTGLSDGQIFQQLPTLKAINIGKTQVHDFSFLKDNSRMSSLGVSDLGLTHLDLLELEHQSDLYGLDLSGNPLTDITQLAALTKLNRLNLSGTKVSDLSPLASFKRIRKVDVSHTEVTDLSVFRALKGVSEISLQGFKGTDISPVIDMMKAQPPRYSRRVDLTGAVQVPCSQMTALQQLRVNIFVEVKPGETCTVN
ncbi:hypothetical protein L4174_013810 [Photobacterium sp. CCB-ST2H9]|uniref:leucine-rich repeat domain-containing protein n=1 Tax=Photobacterium sp. CCB-ST2H9 TaxID=2912855 RepID=UPI0020052401|nr:leucine-rich repeat domain-containing protein [Photobacterium sp. CCB-ST2H9]UTM56876.1 hypothetical protein L4174_013810 [Photobacterium sp. CCB-ST2H9]